MFIVNILCLFTCMGNGSTHDNPWYYRTHTCMKAAAAVTAAVVVVVVLMTMAAAVVAAATCASLHILDGYISVFFLVAAHDAPPGLIAAK